MRPLGALLIFLSFVCGGIVMWESKKRRYRALNQLCLSLELAMSELIAKNTPLPELINILSGRCTGAAADFYGDLAEMLPNLGEMEFSSMWVNASKKHLSMLEAAEQEAIEELGFILGRYELAEQLSALKHTVMLLDRRKETARDNYLKDRKLSIGLCSALGALLAIVCL